MERENGSKNAYDAEEQQAALMSTMPADAQDDAGAGPTPVAVLETKLADEVRLRRFTEDVLDSRQAELEHQEQEKKKLDKRLEALRKELGEVQRQLVEARVQVKSRTRQLHESKEHIFQLQPRRKDLSEAEAQDAYKKLCGNVQHWVENRLPPMLDDVESGHRGTRPAGALATRFAALVREPARRCLSIHQSDEHHVIAVIMYYLWLVFFAKSFYCPLDSSEDDATITWIDELEGAMAKLPRNAAHCREWRSETLTVLTSQALFKTRKTTYISLVSDDLASLLSVVIPQAPMAEMQSSVRKTIIEPAADFAHKLQLASNIFSLKWPARNASTRLEVYECLNLASGGLVLDLGNTTASARQNITYLFDVAPGLFVERIEMGKKASLKAIYRPSVLVYAGESDVAQRPTLMKWVCDSANGPTRDSRTALPRRSLGQLPSGRRR